MYAQVTVLDPKEHGMRKFVDDCRKQTTGKPENVQSESRLKGRELSEKRCRYPFSIRVLQSFFVLDDPHGP